MKRFAFSMLLSLSLSCLFSVAVVGQEQTPGCQFNIAGTWPSSTGGQINPTRERFAANGVMTELSRNSSDALQGTGKSRYKLDDPKKPKAMIVTTKGKSGHASTSTTLEIEAID